VRWLASRGGEGLGAPLHLVLADVLDMRGDAPLVTERVLILP
jgi:hypothetical protein